MNTGPPDWGQDDPQSNGCQETTTVTFALWMIPFAVPVTTTL
jgi:hypothetical protein